MLTANGGRMAGGGLFRQRVVERMVEGTVEGATEGVILIREYGLGLVRGQVVAYVRSLGVFVNLIYTWSGRSHRLWKLRIRRWLMKGWFTILTMTTYSPVVG